MPDADLVPSFQAASDVLGTGWFAATATEAGLTPAGTAPTASSKTVGTRESILQAIRADRPGGQVSYVGVTHDVILPVTNCSSPAYTATAAPHPSHFLPS